MKTPNPNGQPQSSGVKYWQSLDHLAETREFKEWVAQEFPSGASELADPVSRRHFVKIMSASFALAGFGLAGCRRPEEKIIPFTRLPENYIHGAAKFYATSMPNRGSAMPLLVRANEGRPTKVEGNPQHPDSNGATDTHAQASILSLYDQDRSGRYLKNGEVVSRQAAIDLLRELALPGAYGDLGVGNAAVGTVSQAEQLAQKKGGQGLSFLVERSSSPSRERIRKSLLEKFPQATWTTYEPVDFDRHRQAATLAFDQPVQPYYHLDKAKVILSLDSDFLGGEQDSYVHVRRFAAGRDLTHGKQDLNRLYQVEGLFTLTGSNADHRLRIPSSQVSKVASQIAEKILAGSGLPGRWTGDLLKSLIQQGEGLDAEMVNAKWIAECANDLAAHKGECVVLAGHDQPLEVHLIALAMNVALGNLGKTLTLQVAPAPEGPDLTQLAQKLNAGEVDTLVIIGGNPVYNAPAELEWGTAQRKAKNVIRVGYYEDETSQIADWHLPLTHFLETWGDGRSADGTLVAQQPLIAPILDGISELEVLSRIAGSETPRPHDVVRATFKGIAGESEATWSQFLHDGFLVDSAAASVEVKLNWSTVAKRVGESLPTAAPNRGSLELRFHRDYSIDDGRYNNNGWLQEWPDPITKTTWENVIAISYRTAKALGIEAAVEHLQGKVEAPRVEVRLGNRSLEGPVWIQPGQADFTVGLALGYGRGRTGRVGHGAGFNAYQLITQPGMHRASGATITVMGNKQSVSTTQNHWAMEGRAIVREANLSQFQEQPDFVRTMNFQEPPDSQPLYPNPLDVPGKDGQTPREQAHHAWAMVVDLNTCVGCSACVMACQSENNIPIVGKEQVGKSREMHWLRIDRYFSGVPDQSFEEQVENPQSVVQPMMCQHCESAPCESVCPVNATVHDEEGLNLMVYNRCVGTRYCSNNCPYKVRRFNFFDYNRRPLDALYKSPITSTVDGQWALWQWFKRPERGSLSTRDWDLLKLATNPDVTVRMRGVMEKCTFCIQRLEQSKIAQKVQARDSGDVIVPDGTVKTACQQVCPAESITFGNEKDPHSLVSQRQAEPRNYSVLEFLSTRPRVTYLARVRNPNPAMPDYHEYPLTTMDYAAHSGMPIGGHAQTHAPTAEHAGAAQAETEKGGH